MASLALLAALCAPGVQRGWADEAPVKPGPAPVAPVEPNATPAGEPPLEQSPEQSPEQPPDPLAAQMAPLLAAVEGKAREADVRALMRAPAVHMPRFELAAALRLAHAGGPYAARALRELLESPEARVRRMALDGIRQAGLRTRGTSSDDRELARALRDDDPELQRLAVEALGRVGLAEDVESLVAALESESGPMVLAAEHALAVLTGASQGSTAGRWASWWQRNREPLTRAVALALDELEEEARVVPEGEEGAQALVAQEQQAWALVERDAWLLLPDVANRARSWMTQGEVAGRVRGYRLAAALRSLDLVGDLERAQRSGESDPAAAAALERALAAYGMQGLEKKDR
ncbi:MAG: HEAT repeat domain-containing protein [Planctomycetia bacterium]